MVAKRSRLAVTILDLVLRGRHEPLLGRRADRSGRVIHHGGLVKMLRSEKRRTLATLFSVGFLLGVSVQANAQGDAILGCGWICKADCGTPPQEKCAEPVAGICQMVGDITCDASESAIVLEGGVTLDMRGYDIKCTAPTTAWCAYTAVEMSGGSNSLEDSQAATMDAAVISGPFSKGVNCKGGVLNKVTGITIDNTCRAIEDCEIAKNNVIGDVPDALDYCFLGLTGGILITSSGLGSGRTGMIEKNYIFGRLFSIYIDTPEDVQIQRNVVHTGDALQAVTHVDNLDGPIKHNIFFGDGFNSASTLFFVGVGVSDDAGYGANGTNWCDELHPDCGACIAHVKEKCVSYGAPFAGN